jgi:hypothetical protein
VYAVLLLSSPFVVKEIVCVNIMLKLLTRKGSGTRLCLQKIKMQLTFQEKNIHQFDNSTASSSLAAAEHRPPFLPPDLRLPHNVSMSSDMEPKLERIAELAGPLPARPRSVIEEVYTRWYVPRELRDGDDAGDDSPVLEDTVRPETEHPQPNELLCWLNSRACLSLNGSGGHLVV